MIIEMYDIPVEVQRSDKASGVMNFIGWRRLVQHLRATGELRDGEAVKALVIDVRGITYYIE